MVIIPEKLVLYTPLTILALLFTTFTLIVILFKKNQMLTKKIIPASPRFLLAFLISTIGISSIFFIARYQTLHHFYPLIMTWDILFALLLPHWAKNTRFPKNIPIIALVIFISSYLFLFLYNVCPPSLPGYI